MFALFALREHVHPVVCPTADGACFNTGVTDPPIGAGILIAHTRRASRHHLMTGLLPETISWQQSLSRAEFRPLDGSKMVLIRACLISRVS
ncbi:hypothetical protein AB0I53_47150 [Saccharopolyspora sp. NPDC050389]|uniref:hypothetical protein n=1 Tax=Saccharopolyspora sp. NPDC050389 TaxID=3155516 RepID=UPI0033E29B09